MGNAVPVEDLLLLLRSDTVVLVEEVQERTLGFLEGRIGAGLEVTEIREDALFKFLGVPDRASKSLKSKGQASDDIRSRDMK